MTVAAGSGFDSCSLGAARNAGAGVVMARCLVVWLFSLLRRAAKCSDSFAPDGAQ
jgi:hypothetical protein